MAEFDLIARIAAVAGQRADVLLGIGDDGALLLPPAGQHLVAVCDTLNAGVHFPLDTAAAAIGWKALAVNLSDLAAMGAEPAWALLALSLPEADTAFVEAVMQGFSELAACHGVALAGGDTTRGPLALSVTALGFVPAGQALRRDGACAGDEVWVSGSLGDAAAALALPAAGSDAAALRQRLDRPQPRLALGRALRGRASAAIDLSDGLLADLDHIARASAVGIEIQADSLPISPALARQADAMTRLHWQASGGDDYELAFCLPPHQAATVQTEARRQGLPLTRIGRVVAGTGVRLLDARGNPICLSRTGWEHFSGASA